MEKEKKSGKRASFSLKGFVIGSQLRENSFGGYVHECWKKSSRDGGSKKYALKTIDLEVVKTIFNLPMPTIKQSLLQEMEKLTKVRHRNVVRFHDCSLLENRIFLPMDFIEGVSLFTLLSKGPLRESVAKRYFWQICAGVSFCRFSKVIHGALKPENVLIRKVDQRLKLAEFGTPHVLSDAQGMKKRDPLYSPPNDSKISYAWDDWACGVIFYVMVSGVLPFTETQLLSGEALELSVPSHLSDDVLYILEGLLEPNRLSRMTVASMILTSQWLEPQLQKAAPEAIAHLYLSSPQNNSKSRTTDIQLNRFESSDAFKRVATADPIPEGNESDPLDQETIYSLRSLPHFPMLSSSSSGSSREPHALSPLLLPSKRQSDPPPGTNISSSFGFSLGLSPETRQLHSPLSPPQIHLSGSDHQSDGSDDESQKLILWKNVFISAEARFCDHLEELLAFRNKITSSQNQIIPEVLDHIFCFHKSLLEYIRMGGPPALMIPLVVENLLSPDMTNVYTKYARGYSVANQKLHTAPPHMQPRIMELLNVPLMQPTNYIGLFVHLREIFPEREKSITTCLKGLLKLRLSCDCEFVITPKNPQ